jgi:hypothetical protein
VHVVTLSQAFAEEEMSARANAVESTGRSAPLRATVVPGGVNFSVYSRDASGVELLFFDREDDAQPARVITIDLAANRTYHYWHVFVPTTRRPLRFNFITNILCMRCPGMTLGKELRTIVIAGRPELGAPDWRANIPGRPMSAQGLSVGCLSRTHSKQRRAIS